MNSIRGYLNEARRPSNIYSALYNSDAEDGRYYFCSRTGYFYEENEVEQYETTYGAYFGAEDPYATPLTLLRCPMCGSLEQECSDEAVWWNREEYEDESEESEYVL